jgi:hypothetical protein
MSHPGPYSLIGLKSGLECLITEFIDLNRAMAAADTYQQRTGRIARVYDRRQELVYEVETED